MFKVRLNKNKIEENKKEIIHKDVVSLFNGRRISKNDKKKKKAK